jgi:imidazoleglycerol phosphate dehydratase HisB
MKDRIAEETRETTETQIRVRVNLDGQGQSRIASGIGFLDTITILPRTALSPSAVRSIVR